MRSMRLYWLGLFVVLPVLVSTVATFIGLSRVLDGIAVSVNSQERDRSWQAVKSAMASAQNQLKGLVEDNAYWNDAIPHVYGTFNTEWVTQMWGAYSGDLNYDLFFIGTAEGDTLGGFADGATTETTIRQLLGGQAQPLLSALETDTKAFRSASTLANTPFGLAVIAVATIVPTDPTMTIPVERPHVMIYGKLLTPALLGSIGQDFAIDNLDIRPLTSGAPAPEFTLVDAWGSPVAEATWQAREPGNAARAAYQSLAIAITLILIATMLPISVIHFRTLQKLQAKEAHAKTEARQDPLTGLSNRLFLTEHLSRQLEIARRGEMALLFVDLDGFKAVNDTYDHDTGDQLIIAFTRLVGDFMTEGEVFARLGGDEFAILVSGNNAALRAEAMARRVIAAVQRPFNLDGRIASIGASIGMAVLDQDKVTTAEFMRRADVAMYDAKNNGRNTWRLFDPVLDEQSADDARIAREMRDLIDQKAFEVAYQPVFRSSSRTVLGLEVLARWPRTSPRQVEPVRFIAIAEEHGLIDRLFAHVFDLACRDTVECGDIKLYVNVSPLQIVNSNFVPDLKQIAAKHAMPLTRIEVEFTESVMIRNTDQTKRVIADLQREGIKVALDDFGTGYASVGYLRAFQFDKVKLDRSLTQKVASSADALAIVQGTVLIAKGIAAEVTAEGIETEEDAAMMRLVGCSQMQGYYFSKPRTIEEIRATLAETTGPQDRQALSA